jgi:hypothetical protein
MVIAGFRRLMKENKKNEYLQGFRFTVPSGDQGDRDKPFGPNLSAAFHNYGDAPRAARRPADKARRPRILSIY